LTPGTVSLPRGAGFTTVDQNFKRGTITSFNVTYQRLLPFQLNAQIGYVGNRQRDMIRGQNINYGTIGGGAASQPFNQVGLADGLRTTRNISVQRPLGKVNYDSLQVSVSRRMSGGLSFTTAYTYAKSIDWWAASIPIPEFWYLNKGTSGSSIPHKFTASGVYMVPFGAQHAHLNSGFLGGLAGGWQVNAIFTAQSGQPFDITASASSLNAPGSSQRADQVKDEVTIYGFAPGQPYLDPTAFRAVTDARFGNSGLNFLRGPAYANLDMSLFRTFALSRNATFQIRLEVFNVTNTAHFATPGGLNISNVVFNTDGTVKDNGGFGVITQTFAPGREYDERYARVGVRMTF